MSSASEFVFSLMSVSLGKLIFKDGCLYHASSLLYRNFEPLRSWYPCESAARELLVNNPFEKTLSAVAAPHLNLEGLSSRELFGSPIWPGAPSNLNKPRDEWIHHDVQGIRGDFALQTARRTWRQLDS